ncbi:MAG: LacI family DNA-binding transcriptional regulator [Spirochaetales bacterium]|uniref:LacI family DNA-binding transcriptional regulator n=1 Tax=Candidatus Thalassospirochaeta sargassi TaxID=3119039 RepID=A0AAJ1IC28_9SPIO|nr:LacI family DNA-binding transcriptional regulator [Spirochaetales bacterium]
MKVTIKDIAQKLNINFSSVSRALNNKPGVSDETRRLVVKTAKEMGYRPNVIARGLVSRTTKTIGVIIPDIINPLFGEITTGIIETANLSDYDVFLCISNWDCDKEKDYINAVQQKQVDGMIVKSVCNENASLLESAVVPVIGLESWTANNKFSSVSTDNIKGGYLAGKHLIDCGYRKAAIFSGPENSSASQFRRQGFINAFREQELHFDDTKFCVGEYDIESGYNLAKQLLEEHPDTDSIFANNDVIALGILQYLEEKGIKPGKDIGVIGFDNIRMAGLPQIQLTTVKQPKHSLGRIMVNLLLDEIKNHSDKNQHYPQRILLEPELIVRGTTSKQS